MLRERINYNNDFKLDWHDPDEATDGYQLKWVGKNYARLQCGMETETIVIPDTRHNEKEINKNSSNIFFTGDNLEVLKHLQNAYKNTIKMIYIDPPYNTGNEFAYNDTFQYSDEKLKNMLGISDNEIKRLHTINGRSSHSAWLTFMYPRLKIAKKLLKDNGVVFISIDDNEQANLKLLCDEIFGEDNVDVMIWRKSGAGRDGKMKHTTTFRKDHEYIIVCFNGEQILNKSFEKPNWENDYGNPDNDPRGAYKSGSISKKEEASNPNSSKYYSVKSPTGKVYTRQFDIDKDKFMALDKDGRIYWGVDGNAVPSVKIFVNEKREVTTSSYIIEKDDYLNNSAINDKNSTTTEGSKELNELFNIADLGNEMRPKPTDLIEKFLQIGTNENDIILDFFAGTGTTCQAVFQHNIESNKNIKFIAVQIPETTYFVENNEKFPKPNAKIAYENGFNTIDQIAMKRIELAQEKLKAQTKNKIDYGYQHYIVEESKANTIDKIVEFDIDSNKLIAEDMVQEFNNAYSNGADVILKTWLLSDGYKINTPIQKIDLNGYEAYYIDNSLLYLINLNWNQEQTKQLANLIGRNELNINTIILYGYSFTFESTRELEVCIKQNFENKIQIEKRY